MNWFLVALITPFVHSLANFVDKILLSKYFQGFSLFVFMIYSAVTSIIVLPIFLAFGGMDVLQVSLSDILILMFAGVLGATAIYFYLFALYREDASVIVPFFQLIPIFSFILGFVILNEVISGGQIAGSIIIILGAAILSFEIEEGKKIRFRKHVIFAVTMMGLLWALAGVLFKFVAVSNDFWLSNFWETVGFALVGIAVFIFRKNDRKAFLESLKTHKSKIMSVLFLSEALTLAGNITSNFAFMLAPVVLVRVTEGYQAIFALVIGIIITKMFPKVLQEKMHWKHMAPKILTVILIFVGSYLILS